MTTEAVIVSTARTGVGKAFRGALNNTEGPTMAGHVMAEAVRRAGIDPGEVEDVVIGCAMQQGTMVMNVARKGAIRAGLPVTVAGTTIDRQCASGLQAIAVAARSIMLDGVEVAIGGGIESISLVQNEHMNRFHAVDDELMAMKPEMYMSMLDTAEIVAERYKIGRDRQDEYSLECQRRIGAAVQAGRFNDEIVPITTRMAVVNKDTKEVTYQQVTLSKDEGPRPETTAEGLAKIKPVFEGKTITAGNAEPALRWRIGVRGHERQDRCEEGPEAARHLPWLRRRRCRAGRNGHRSGRGDPAPSQAARPEDRRH